jgi:biopolymer transport protein ExbB
MANVKKESGSNGGGMFSGIVIVSCIFVGLYLEIYHG